MAQQTIQIADKPTLDATYKKVQDIYNSSIPSVQSLKRADTGFYNVTTNQTINVSVAGKGKLYGAILRGSVYTGKYSTLTISIDGNVVINIKHGSSAKSSQFYTGILNPNIFRYANYNGYDQVFFTGHNHYYTPHGVNPDGAMNRLNFESNDIYNRMKILDLSPTFVDRTNTNSNQIHCHDYALILDYIPFNESVEMNATIEAGTSLGASAGMSMLYTLDE